MMSLPGQHPGMPQHPGMHGGPIQSSPQNPNAHAQQNSQSNRQSASMV